MKPPIDAVSPLEEAIVRWTVPLFPAVVVIAAGVMGAIRGAPGAVLVLAGGTLVTVIASLWQSIRVLVGEAPLSLEASLSHGDVVREDEKKQAVLRALKDLDYERSVGKLSDDDFRSLSARYRAEAKALLRAQDEALAPARAEAEALIQKRLRGEAIDPVEETEPPPKRGKKKARTKPTTELGDPPSSGHERACPGCQTANDEDAKFCKSCGEKLG